MRLEQLEILVNVAETHSMQKSADNLYTTIQNVSKSIKQLEKELGVVLFQRTKHGVFLTPDGEFIYQKAKIVQDSVSAIKEKYNFFSVPSDDKLDGNLNILTCPALGTTVAYVSQKLRSLSPSLNIKNIIEDPLNISNYLFHTAPENILYDIIITSIGSKDIEKFESLSTLYSAYFFREERLGICISAKHPFAQLDTIPIKLLHEVPLIALSSNQEATASHLLAIVEKEIGKKLTPSITTNRTDQYINYIANNLGYGIMTCSEDVENQNVCVIPLKEKLYISYLLLIANHDILPEPVKAFSNHLSKQYKESYVRLF